MGEIARRVAAERDLQSRKRIRQFIAEQFALLLENPDFEHFLAGNIRGPEGRIDIVRERFARISQGAGD